MPMEAPSCSEFLALFEERTEFTIYKAHIREISCRKINRQVTDVEYSSLSKCVFTGKFI